MEEDREQGAAPRNRETRGSTSARTPSRSEEFGEDGIHGGSGGLAHDLLQGNAGMWCQSGHGKLATRSYFVEAIDTYAPRFAGQVVGYCRDAPKIKRTGSGTRNGSMAARTHTSGAGRLRNRFAVQTANL